MSNRHTSGSARGSTSTPLTWTGLLAHWTALAQSSLSLPPTATVQRWRDSIASIVGLQAVTHALADLAPLPGDDHERLLGQDKAEVLVRRHADELVGVWGQEPMADELLEIIGDARRALALVREAGVEWRVPNDEPRPVRLEHPGELADTLVAGGFGGDLFLASAGIPMMPGAPIGFARAPRGGSPPRDVLTLVTAFLSDALERSRLAPARASPMRQVYRQFDFSGVLPKSAAGVRRDLVAPWSLGPQPGQPLLVPVIDRGRVCPVALPPPPGAIDLISGVPVVELSEDESADPDTDVRTDSTSSDPS